MSENDEDEILNLLGVALGGLSHADLSDALLKLGVRRTGGFKHSVQTLVGLLRRMEVAGLLRIDGVAHAPDGTHDAICRKLLDRGRFLEVAEVVTDVAPGSAFGVRSQRGPDLRTMRDIRIELYSDRPVSCLRLAAQAAEAWDDTASHVPPLTAALVPPVGREWLDALEGGLLDRGFHSLRLRDTARRSGILGVEPPRGFAVKSLAEGLNRMGFAVSTPDGVLRFAPHWPNAFTEIPALLDALDTLMR